MNTKLSVVWEDISTLNESWTTKDSAIEYFSKPCVVETIGLLVFENDKYIVLTDSYCEKLDIIGNCTSILKSVILDISELEYIK